MNDQLLLQRAKDAFDFTCQVRHHLHSIPEPGFAETKTQQYICKTLDGLGIPYTTERTWVIATIEGAGPGETIALRADMDALPIQEKTGLPFTSTHDGWMHACGHDAHMAIQLGAAKVLMELRDTFSGTVRLLFQPAEETEGGAQPMIREGAMEGVSKVYGLHVAAQAPVGIASRPGPMYAACDELFIHVLGRKGHGAHPTTGVDAIVIAAQLITALQTLVTREAEATDPVIFTVGSIHGGTACNILCDDVELHATLRTLYPGTRDRFRSRITALSEGIARAMGGDVSVKINPGYCACVNHSEEADRVLRIAARLFGEEKTRLLQNSSMGGEDFAFYLQEAPGAIYLLGCGSKASLHNEAFTLDEDCLSTGVAMQVALVLDSLGNK